jgi:hypothetical protein
MEDLAGVGSGREDRVVAEDLGVAVCGALLGFAGHLADRGVHVDHHPVVSRARSQLPRPGHDLADHRLELADMPEAERPQEDAQRGGGHHPMTQHPPGVPGAQDVGVVDVAGAGDKGVHQRQHLAARSGAADQTGHTDRSVHQRRDTEPGRQRRDHDQPGVGHQPLIVEAHRQPVRDVRYWPHRKCLPGEGWMLAW